MNRFAIAFLALSLALSALLGAQDAHTPTVIKVDASYGTLAFRGTIDRLDLGSTWEFRPHFDITFQHDEHLNKTDRIDLAFCLVVASLVREPNRPGTVLFQDRRPAALTFTEVGQTRRLPEMVFRVDKTAVADANHLLLGLGDNRVLWPIPVELR